MNAIKIAAGILLLVLVSNLVLYGLGKISVTGFWFVLVVGGIGAYGGIPLLKRQMS